MKKEQDSNFTSQELKELKRDINAQIPGAKRDALFGALFVFIVSIGLLFYFKPSFSSLSTAGKLLSIASAIAIIALMVFLIKTALNLKPHKTD